MYALDIRISTRLLIGFENEGGRIWWLAWVLVVWKGSMIQEHKVQSSVHWIIGLTAVTCTKLVLTAHPQTHVVNIAIVTFGISREDLTTAKNSFNFFLDNSVLVDTIKHMTRERTPRLDCQPSVQPSVRLDLPLRAYMCFIKLIW